MTRLARSELFNPGLLEGGDGGRRAVEKRFQSVLVQGKNRLTEYHLEGGNSATLARNLGWLTDQLLAAAWERFFPGPGRTGQPLLIAAGGYGRRELNLESDIDLLILLGDRPRAHTRATVERFIQFCWDMGLKVGHGARTRRQCVKAAARDLSIATNLMEARLLTGDPAAFSLLREQSRTDQVWPAARFFRAKLGEQQARHLRFGDTAYNLEPNVKESPGGLRDLHMISWVASRYFDTGDFSELVERGFLTATEYRALIKARDFLWRLRNGLHVLAGRREDRLLFDYQKELAAQLGYRRKGSHMAVEQMMQQYYRTVKEVQLLNELSLQHFQEAILKSRKPRPARVNERFQTVGNYLEIGDPALFEKHPEAMLEMFNLLQKTPRIKGVRAGAIRALRDNLHRIDGSFRKNPDNQRRFLEIFRQQDGLTHALRKMNAYGVLGAFFPDFGRVVGQMQHDLFHIFTVDAHSLFVVGNLRRLMDPRHADEFPVLRGILTKLNQRERLYLAALCHDIGKGSGEDHSVAGERIARKMCRRMQMSRYDREFVAWLVRNHLIMSWTAQREDTSDPRVIDRFAELVGDQEHLDNLYLLTVADMRGTSHKVWNEWKGLLLSNLYTATSRRLRSGIGGAEAINQRIEDRKNAIRKILGDEVPGAELNRIWQQLDQEYFLRNGPESCAWHARKLHQASLADLPLVAIRYRPEIHASQVLLVAPESETLLAHATAALDRLSLGILDARIHQAASGLGILVFITSPATDDTPSERELEQQAAHVRGFILEPPERYRPAARTLTRAQKQFAVPTTVTFSDNRELGHTTMEIVSRDRPGLLYHVSTALLECRVKLVSAKVSTVGEKAEDTFFITDRDGHPVPDGDPRTRLENAIIERLG